MNLTELLPELLLLMQRVTAAMIPLYEAQESSLRSVKADGSPLTHADLLAHTLIKDCLMQLTPEIPIISEESCATPFVVREKWARYWLVDPIDGTKEFLAKTGEFTINIALIEHHQPILGVVAIPVCQTIYYAIKGEGAWKQVLGVLLPLRVEPSSGIDVLRIVASRRHGQEVADNVSAHFAEVQLMRCGSSLKFCLLAEGLADLYPRLGPTSEWDTAAGQCVLEEAGGNVTDFEGNTLRYNTKDSYLNPHFLASAHPNIDWCKMF